MGPQTSHFKAPIFGFLLFNIGVILVIISKDFPRSKQASICRVFTQLPGLGKYSTYKNLLFLLLLCHHHHHLLHRDLKS